MVTGEPRNESSSQSEVVCPKIAKTGLVDVSFTCPIGRSNGFAGFGVGADKPEASR
jgi:hypothetical protein